jgi:hypothetical protein
MRRVLLVGPTILTLGGLVIAVSFLTRQAPDVRTTAVVAGFALVIGGATFTLAGMHGILRREVSLVVRTDGVFVQSASAETLVPWDDLLAVRWDAGAAALILERSSGEAIVVARPPARMAGPELAARVLQHKRKAAMNLPP